MRLYHPDKTTAQQTVSSSSAATGVDVMLSPAASLDAAVQQQQEQAAAAAAAGDAANELCVLLNEIWEASSLLSFGEVSLLTAVDCATPLFPIPPHPLLTL